ncbi:MAG TPA: ribosome-associated translation inhibitor RaiA [Bdellovibrionota bacterium]|jgi:putative sigma-54 modulation protein|nr:ribosome-associated translation inhibitor RaiA [Bdellovibrionota bacterium]
MISDAKLQVTTTFKGMDSTESIKEYAMKKAHKIVKHLHHMTTCSFVFSIEKTDHVAEVFMSSGDFEAKAVSKAESLYAAIDEVTDKLVNQTRKHKERAGDHSGDPHHGQ